MSKEEFQFQDLVDALEREKGSRTLEELEDDFFSDMRHFISTLEEEVSQNSQDINAFSKMGFDQLLKAKSMSDSLINLRLKKISIAAVHQQMGVKKVDTEYMTHREKELFNDIKDLLSEAKGELIAGEYRRKTREKTTPKSQKKPIEKAKEELPEEKTTPKVQEKVQNEVGEELLVHIVEDVPTFVDMETTYSLKKEDVVTLRLDLAKVLISRGLARKVDFS